MRSPSISDFRPYIGRFRKYIGDSIGVDLYQVVIGPFVWEEGPRLRMLLKVFPQYGNNSNVFSESELQRVMDQFAQFLLPSNPTFGPYDLLDFILIGPYKYGMSLELYCI